MKAGDRVLIHRGDYREVVIVLASGTEKEPIVFEAAPGEKPVIKGSDVISGWTRDKSEVWKASLPALPPRGTSLKENPFWDTSDVRQIFTRDGELLDAQRLRRVTSRAAMEAGTFFCDPTAAVLFVWLVDSNSPNEHPPEVSVRGGWLLLYGNHIIVRGLAMRHASTTAISNWPACSLIGDETTLEECSITWGDFAGVHLAGNRQRLLNNVIACNGDSGVSGTGSGHLIEGCRVIYNNVDRFNPDWHGGGAKLIPKFQHGVIRHNEFAHNFGPGLWLDNDCDENLIDGNSAHDNEGPGIMVEVSRGNLVANNISVANRNFLSGAYREASGKEEHIPRSEQRIAPSRLLKIYHAGDGRGIYISSAPETRVLNNTVYLNEGEGICVEGPPRGGMSTRGSVVMNNISVFNHGSQLTLPSGQNQTETPPVLSDYNLLFSVGAVLAKNGWAGSASWTINEWQKSSGQDAHSFDVDPQFAMAAMDDFRPLATSAALGSGTPQRELDHDFLGQFRGKEKTAIGAFEAPALIYPLPAWHSLPSSR